MSRTKVHKILICVVDHDDLGASGVLQELANARFPNDCVSLDVVQIQTREVNWSDDHPLNRRATFAAAFGRLFAEGLDDE